MPPRLPGHFEAARAGATLAGQHAASGTWMGSTLKGYSSGMAKFIEFKEKTAGGFNADAPIKDDDIYDFIAWAGKSQVQKDNGPNREIASGTIKNYLNGIRAWHVIKHRRVPSASTEVVGMLLNATERMEEQKSLETMKQPVMVHQLFDLVRYCHKRSPEHDLVASTAIVAFWGMARLGELLRDSAGDGALLRHHVEFGESDGERFVQLHLRKAKTARKGEIQIIHLRRQHNILDPVAAMERLMRSNTRSDRDDLVFAVPRGGRMVALKKARFLKLAEEIWGTASIGTWSGHSFRVGGASLRFNLGTSMKRIARQGRWKSLTYLRYLKAYTEDDIKYTIEFLRAIEDRSLANN